MNITELHREIEELFSGVAPIGDGRASRLEELFNTFRACERNLDEYNRSSGGAEDDVRADWVIEMQTIIMAKAAATPAATLNDVLLKLAMWRWDAPDLDEEMDAQRYDAMALSAFRDLARLLNNDAVLRPCDIEAARRPRKERRPDDGRSAAAIDDYKKSASGGL